MKRVRVFLRKCLVLFVKYVLSIYFFIGFLSYAIEFNKPASETWLNEDFVYYVSDYLGDPLNWIFVGLCLLVYKLGSLWDKK